MALRLGRPRRFGAAAGCVGGDWPSGLTRGGKARRNALKTPAAAPVASVRSSQLLPSCLMVACCSRSRSRRTSSHSSCKPIFVPRPANSFCSTRARKEQKTWPRMAASEEWKIGRVRSSGLGRAEQMPRPGAGRDSAAWPATADAALVRSTKMPSNLASSASLPASISKAGAGLLAARQLPDADAAEIAAVGGVADQRLVAALQLLLERGDDRLRGRRGPCSASASLRQTM